MDNKSNQNPSFSGKRMPKKDQKLGDKMERLGDKISQNNNANNSDHSRDSQR